MQRLYCIGNMTLRVQNENFIYTYFWAYFTLIGSL